MTLFRGSLNSPSYNPYAPETLGHDGGIAVAEFAIITNSPDAITCPNAMRLTMAGVQKACPRLRYFGGADGRTLGYDDIRYHFDAKGRLRDYTPAGGDTVRVSWCSVNTFIDRDEVLRTCPNPIINERGRIAYSNVEYVFNGRGAMLLLDGLDEDHFNTLAPAD